jgi:hypothetical protein
VECHLRQPVVVDAEGAGLVVLLKMECSIVWYFWIDLGESPSAAALVTQSWTSDGVIWLSSFLPKNGKKCLFKYDEYAALVVASMCLDGSQSFSTYCRNGMAPSVWSCQSPARTRCSSRLPARSAALWDG